MNFAIDKSTVTISAEDAKSENACECAKEIYDKVGINNVVVVTGIELGENDRLSKVLQKFIQNFKDKIVVWDVKSEKLGDYLKLRYCLESLGFYDLSFVFDNGINEKLYLLLNKNGEELYRALQIYTVGSTVLDSMNDSNADLLTRTILQNPVVKKKLKKAMRSRNDLERSESF